jgi:hypothetical protein
MKDILFTAAVFFSYAAGVALVGGAGLALGAMIV